MATIRRNYTLVELLIVCAIILVLVGIGSGGYALVQTKIKESRTTSLLKRIETALENTKAKHGYYPPASTGMALELDLKLDEAKPAQKSYLEDYRKTVDYESLLKNSKPKGSISIILDAYGYPIYYRCPGLINRNSFDLMSCGKDGQVGDTGKDLWQGQPFTLNTSLNGSVDLQKFDNKNHDDIGNF